MCANEDPSPKQWLFAMMETLSRDDFARVAVTLLAIWFTRRKIIHEEVYQSPLSTHLFIETYLHDLSLTVKSQTLGKGGSKQNHPKWIPPRPGCVKINVDAAVEKVEVGGAVGAMSRAEDGTFLGASILKIRGINDPAVLEAIACREAMALAEDLYERKVTMATDCLSVVNNMEQAYDGPYIMVINEVKARAKTLSEVTFRHENRASNSEAHNLAHLAGFFWTSRLAG
jgi:ribonuclease HI